MQQSGKDFYSTTPIRRERLHEYPIDADFIQNLKLWPSHNVFEVRMYKFAEIHDFAFFVGAPVPVNMQYWGGLSYAEGARSSIMVNLQTREHVYSIGSADYEGPVFVNDVKAATRRLQGDTRFVIEWTDSDDGTSDGIYLDHLRAYDGKLVKKNKVTVSQSVPEGTDCEYPLCDQIQQ